MDHLAIESGRIRKRLREVEDTLLLLDPNNADEIRPIVERKVLLEKELHAIIATPLKKARYVDDNAAWMFDNDEAVARTLSFDVIHEEMRAEEECKSAEANEFRVSMELLRPVTTERLSTGLTAWESIVPPLDKELPMYEGGRLKNSRQRLPKAELVLVKDFVLVASFRKSSGVMQSESNKIKMMKNLHTMFTKVSMLLKMQPTCVAVNKLLSACERR